MPRTVKAAVVNDFKSPPSYQDIEIADPSESQVQIKVLATGLHQLVKSRASGAHYSANITLPLIPGVDGVGELPDGELKYFMTFNPTSTGSFAEYANVAKDDLLPVPRGADPAVVGGLLNPAMSSWLALRNRVELKKGFTVLILGVTGASGQLAVQIARLLGASRIVGAGRNQKALNDLLANGLDAAITLSDDQTENEKAFAQEAANIDVVLDYLYGPVAEIAMRAIISQREVSSHRLDWVQIGSMAGQSISLPANALRAANFYISGSGLGSISMADFRTELTELIKHLASGKLTGSVDPQSLKDVATAWTAKSDGRQVFVL
ncbi:hypothetical protein K450DRAFT_198975 [Umbelopsis ramanniana AG]|uniref:Enoyl reductase (ER) domain-containing protein n=1 Tax=Umbelopsis ramanniana AG TaxID=1314678 RepID=A0AAD5ECT8_UMBRA|nr:uncharacterized protein K450DRAFT_198975 [Umbelopsis ramanniana AG]KAI8579880.1 hypothetical protein K450DRAFT_198975 [Umbelopsis ramanniana AG]